MRKILIFIISILFSHFLSAISTNSVNNLSIPVLCYHQVEKRAKNSYTVKIKNFKRQMQYLYKKGFRTISLDKLIKFIKGDYVILPKKPVVITFDDGHISQYKYALPILRKYNYKGVFFIYPTIITSSRQKTRRLYMSKYMLKKLHKMGMEVESHSLYHPVMHKENNRTNNSQFRNSKIWLEKLLKKRIKYFAYPFGSYTTKIMRLGLDNKYSGLFTINYGSVSRFTSIASINRYMITRNFRLKNFKRIVNSKALEIIKSDPYDGGVYKKLKYVLMYFKKKIKKRNYKFTVKYNGRRVKKIHYYTSRRMLYFYTKNSHRGVNNVQIILIPKSRGKKTLIASWSFIYKKHKSLARRRIKLLRKKMKRIKLLIK